MRKKGNGTFMIEFNSKNIRFLSHIGARGVLGQALLDMAKDGRDFFVVSADLAKAAGYDRLEKQFPEYCINTGIAEQSMIGVAAGLSKTGIPVFASSWAVFSALRIADQMRNYMGSMKLNIKLVGLDSGLTKVAFGASHSNPQDIALFRSQPNIRIISPSDGQMLYKSIYSIQEDNIPTYLRMTGGENLPIIYKNNYKFQIGKANILRTGRDVGIISTGTILSQVLSASDQLSTKNIECTIVDINTIKPLDIEAISGLLDMSLLVTVEEHSIYGGLGGAIAEILAKREKHPPLLILGIKDSIMGVQNYESSLEKNGLLGHQIAEQISSFLGKEI